MTAAYHDGKGSQNMRDNVVALLTAYLLGAVVPCAILFARGHAWVNEDPSSEVRVMGKTENIEPGQFVVR